MTQIIIFEPDVDLPVRLAFRTRGRESAVDVVATDEEGAELYKILTLASGGIVRHSLKDAGLRASIAFTLDDDGLVLDQAAQRAISLMRDTVRLAMDKPRGREPGGVASSSINGE